MAFQITLHQMLIFLIIIVIGYIAAKRGLVTRDALPHLAKLITNIFLPAMGFMATWSGSTREALFGNWWILIFTAVYYAILTALIFGLSKLMRLKGDRDRVFTFCFTFGNLGFVGIPLITAMMPGSGMLYYAVFFIIDTAYFWTFGQFWCTPHNAKFSVAPRNLININVISLLLALLFIVLQIPLPEIAADALSTLAGATTACCMVYLGALLCFSNWLSILKCPELYVGIAVKMVAVPVVVGMALVAIGLPTTAAVVMATVPSLPCMTLAPILVDAKGSDGEYAAGIMAATLVVSIVTIPLVQFLLGF